MTTEERHTTTPLRYEYFMEGDPSQWFGRLYFFTEEGRDDALSAIVRATRANFPASADYLVAEIVAHYRRSKFATLAITGRGVRATLQTMTRHGIVVQPYADRPLPEDRE